MTQIGVVDGMAEQEYQLACRHVKYDDTVWDTIEETSLVNVVDGGPVQDATGFKACWDDEYLYVRFDCQDDYMVANFTKRDDPLYDEDVVELFIDEAGSGTRYMEFEFSPRNVIFDAMIDNQGGQYKVDLEWDAEGLETEVRMGELSWTLLMKLPLSHFLRKPENGTAWRVNFYRIDEKRDGTREYQAWSPTGAVNYHIPSRFGTLRFVR